MDRLVASKKESHIWAIPLPWPTRVNLAEQENSSWKCKKPLRLVHAAKNDTATMILQEEELYDFAWATYQNQVGEDQVKL